MYVGEICTREVVVARREETIQEAARLMRKHHVGDVVVVEEREGAPVPVGILTDRDIVVELLGAGISPEAVCIGDIMSFDLVTIHEEEDVTAALKRMKAGGVRRAPVVNDEGALVGILAVDDLVELASEQLSDLVRLMLHERRREEELRGGA